jgi:hypothetical protein
MAANEVVKAAEFRATPPSVLTWEGQQPWQAPRLEVRYFHRKKIEVWNGYVRTKDIKGWVDNIRIKLFVDKWKRDHAGALPTNDDILGWMAADPNDEFRLHELADSIVKNGVRMPVVITSHGDLLDGNRRYFTSLMKLHEAEKTGDKGTLAMVSQLPAYVLSPSCTKEDFDKVLVEENFVEDVRIKWPNYIKASKVYEAYQELIAAGIKRTIALQELSDQFGIKKAWVERYIKVMNGIQEFEDFHLESDEEAGRLPKDEYEVKWRAQKYFEYFDELGKAQVQRVLESDPELREKVMERLFDGDFVSFTQIRKIPLIAADRKARDKFMLNPGPEGVKEAIDWVTVTGVAKKALNNNERIASFARFLENLGAKEIAELDPISVEDLEQILETVVAMARAAHSRKRS